MPAHTSRASFMMKPDSCGLTVALRQMATDFAGRSGIQVNCDLEELPERLPADTETTVYRIAQEALTNAARYAGASRVELSLSCNGRSLQFRIQNDGTGFNASRFGSGLGLLGMRERADMLNAEFHL